MVEEVDEKSFDVGAILILVPQEELNWPNWVPVHPTRLHATAHLIRHDHDLAVTQTPQGFGVVVALFVLEPNDFDDVVNLCVFHNL